MSGEGMTNVPLLLQEAVACCVALSTAAEKCEAALEEDAYDLVNRYINLRQFFLDAHIAPRMARIASIDKEFPETDDPSLGEMKSKIGDLIRQILEKDRCCMEKIQKKRKALQSAIREIRDGTRAVHGYGPQTDSSPQWVRKEA